MGNEVSQPTNYNNDTLNRINNVLNTNTEMYQPNQITQSGGSFEKGVRVQSKKNKQSGTIIDRVTNSAFPGNVWKVTFDNGETHEWPESDLNNLADEEKKRRDEEERKRRATEEAEKHKREEEERKRRADEEAEKHKREEEERKRKEAEEKERARLAALEKEKLHKEEMERARLAALEKEKLHKEEMERARLAAEEKEKERKKREAEESERRKKEAEEKEKQRKEQEKKQIEEEIRKNEVLIENFEAQLKSTSETLASRPDSERQGLINKLKEYETEKMKHVTIVNGLKQKLAGLK
jgi:hypothetical protein